MKTWAHIAGIWVLAFTGITLLSVESILAENKPKQKTGFEILSGKIEVIAIYKPPPKRHWRAEKEELEGSPVNAPAFDIIVKAKDTSFSISTLPFGGIRNVEDGVSQIKEGIKWKSEYLFVLSECGGGNAWRCNAAQVFTIRGDQLIHIGSVASPYESTYQNDLFYDIYDRLEVNPLTSHAAAPSITTVMREVNGHFVVDRDLTWEKNQQRYEENMKIIESADDRTAEIKDRDERFIAAILFNAALAKYCDRTEELGSFVRRAQVTIDEDRFRLFKEVLSIVQTGQVSRSRHYQIIEGHPGVRYRLIQFGGNRIPFK
jgi:hypothetical protein